MPVFNFLVMNHTEIQNIIAQAGIGYNGYLSPTEGDCGSIAVAIQDVFGGGFVGVTEEPNGNVPCHVAVEIDNKVYHGNGQSSLESFVNYFIIEEHRVEDISRHYWSGDSVPYYMVDDEKVQMAKNELEQYI